MTTTPIDPTKIRPGDKVTFHETEVVGTGTNFVRVRFSGIRDYDIDLRDIATHTPKQREFKPGDRVFHENTSPQMAFEIIAVDKGVAWVRYDGGHRAEWELHKLRHADDGDDR